MKKLFLIFFYCAAIQAQAPSATTIKVGLFTTGIVHSLTVTPLSEQSWIQNCDTCSRSLLHSPMHLSHLRSPIQFGGTFRVQPDGRSSGIEATGIYRAEFVDNRLRVTLQMPSEHYIAAVLSGEGAPDEPLASLKALAIVARTFMLTNLNRHKAEGFDFCDSTHCQAIRIGSIRPSILEAVRNTTGITLWDGNRRSNVYYTQHCGGISEAASTLWPSNNHSGSHADPYCIRKTPAHWHTDIPLKTLVEIAAHERWQFPSHLDSVDITRHTRSGRASLLIFSGGGITSRISATSLRFAINRTLGWNQLRSDLYTVSLAGDKLHFDGRGYGHGVGLCQIGAFEMALEHHTDAEILAFYFPGTHIGFTPSTGVWQTETIDGIRLRTLAPQPELTRATKYASLRALQLLPAAGEQLQTTITLSPNTEIFRQISSSPGYLLAVTHGDQIILQPMNILRANGSLENLLLHELLHILAEKQSTDKTPLWLREGLPEALTTIDKPFSPSTHSLEEIEHALANPSSLAASQQAHREAAATVRTLGQTYSLDVMRSWLHTGVPQSVLQQLN